MEEIIAKIKEIRKKKGLSHENMAFDLNISPSTYTKIERMDVKLSVERLMEIAKILDTPIEEIMMIGSRNVYHQNLSDSSIGHQEIQNLYQENRETTEKLFHSQEKSIKRLEAEVLFLRNMLKSGN